jgi:hypothetical protein
MPEQVPVVDTPIAAPAAPSIDPAVKAELDQQMAISLNGGMLPQPAAGQESGAASAPAGDTPPPPSDPFGIFKEKFGYESPEAAVQEIEALRAFRSAPPAAELKFENEDSRRVVEALQKGDFKPVYEVLDKHMQIDRLTAGDMTPETAAEVVKLGMQLKYKDLTAAEINYKFNKQYALPPKPGLLPSEDQEEYNQRVAAWEAQVADRQMELMIDAKLARPELTSSKSKLVFPTISRPEETAFQQWQNSIVENDRLAAEATQEYKAFTPTSLAMKLHFNDEPNKINFDFTHEPDPDSFKVAMDLVSDMQKFWDHFHDSAGKPDRKSFLKFVYNGLNAEKIVNDALHQSKNATVKAKLPDNSTGGLVRNLPQGQEQTSELDAYMRASLKGHGGF